MSTFNYKRLTVALLIEGDHGNHAMALTLSLVALFGLLFTCVARVDALVQRIDAVVAVAVAAVLLQLLQVEGGGAMVYPLTCLALFIIVALLFAVAWFFWPRVQHARLMQSPEQRRAALHAQRERELELLQQEMRIEEAAARIEERRAKTEQFRSVVRLAKGESAFTVDGQFFHAEKPMLLDQPHQQQAAEPVPELMPLLMKCDNILIVARRGAGKSNLIRRIIDQRQHVTVLDPHASPQQWGHHEVVGAGLEHGDIEAYLHDNIETERRGRYRRLGQGAAKFPQKTIAIDEMTEITSETDVATPVQRLLNCRKVNMTCIVGGHSMNAKDIGLKGSFNLLKNFDAVVKIDYNIVTDKRRYWICLQPQTHHDEFTETANPGPYIPPQIPVPDRSKAVPHPERPGTGTPAERLPERYEGRDLEIAEAILRGWSKTKTRRSVTGRAADIGNRYDEIKAELEAQPPATEPAAKRPQKAVIVVPDKESREVLH